MKKSVLYSLIAMVALGSAVSCSNQDPTATTTYYCDMMDVVTPTNGPDAGNTRLFLTTNTFVIDYIAPTMLYSNHLTTTSTFDLRTDPIPVSIIDGLYAIKSKQLTPTVNYTQDPNNVVTNFNAECIFTKTHEYSHASYDYKDAMGNTFHVFSYDTTIKFDYNITLTEDEEGNTRKILDIYYATQIDPNLQKLNLTISNAPVGIDGRLIEVLQLQGIPLKPIIPTAENKQDGFTFEIPYIIPIVERVPYPDAAITDLKGEILGTSGQITLTCQGIKYDIRLHATPPLG